MSRIIEQFLERKLNGKSTHKEWTTSSQSFFPLIEYRRKSKSLLIVYQRRYHGTTKKNFQKKKRIMVKDLKQNIYHSRDEIPTENSAKCIDWSKNSDDILDTILRTWSSNLDTDLSNFFEESSYTSGSTETPSIQEFNINNNPFHDPNTVEPVWYWNLETDNIRQRLDERCDCKKKKPTTPLHLDTISRLRLQSFIRSLCEDKCNTQFCQPEEDPDKKAANKSKRKKQKDKKKCKRDSSMVSFHITVPKQTKSVTLKNDANPRKLKKSVCDESKIDDESKKCKNCPYFTKNQNFQTEDLNQGCLVSEPGDVTLKLGNQTITISVKKVNDDGVYDKGTTQVNNITQKYPYPSYIEQNVSSRNQEPAQNSSVFKKSQSLFNKEKPCDCDQQLRRMKEDLKKYVLSQLNINDELKDADQPSEKNKFKTRTADICESKREERRNLDRKCCQKCTCKGFRRKINDEELEQVEDEKFSNKKYTRCVKICVKPVPEVESSDEDDIEVEDSRNRSRLSGTGGRKLCGYKECPWRKNKTKKESETQSCQKKSFRSSKNETAKCCSCSSNTETKERKKCECLKSKKKQPKLVEKCCQCQPNQDKDTQVKINKNESEEDPDEVGEKTSVNKDESDDGTQSKKNSVAETYSVKTDNSSRKQSKSSTVQQSDSAMKDESCSCCICDEETSDEDEQLEDSEDDEVKPVSKKPKRRKKEEVCDCESSDEEFERETRKKSLLKTNKNVLSKKERGNSFSFKFCGDTDDEDPKHLARRKKQGVKGIRPKVTSTEGLIECDCGEFEQIMSELEEYCRTKCVNFKVSESPYYYKPEKQFCSRTTTAQESIFMAEKDRLFQKFHAPSVFFKASKDPEENTLIVTSQDEKTFRRNMSTRLRMPKTDIKYKSPRITSSKLSDQKLNRKRRIESHYRKSRVDQIGFLLI